MFESYQIADGEAYYKSLEYRKEDNNGIIEGHYRSNGTAHEITHYWKDGDLLAVFYSNDLITFSRKNAPPFLKISNFNKLDENYVRLFFSNLTRNEEDFSKDDYLAATGSSIVAFNNSLSEISLIEKILDDNVLSPLSKIAAIISYLKHFQNISEELVLKVAHAQYPAEMAKSKTVHGLETFLRPDFLVEGFKGSLARRGSFSNRPSNHPLNKSPDDEYELALYICAFLFAPGDDNETFKSFMENNSFDNCFVKSDPEGLVLKVSQYFFGKGSVHYIKSDLADNTRDEIIFRVKAFSHFSSEESIKEKNWKKIYRKGIASNPLAAPDAYSEIENKSNREPEYTSNKSIFMHILTADEFLKFSKLFKKYNYDLILDPVINTILVESFIKSGFANTKKIFDYIFDSCSRDYLNDTGRLLETSLNEVLSVGITANEETFKVQESLQLLIDPENFNYPIEWLLSIDTELTAESESESDL